MNHQAFTYWDTPNLSQLSNVIAHWADRVGGLAVVGDADVIQVLSRIDPSFIDTYERIRIPAARSDVARLVMLYERGGLYVDSHCGVTDESRTKNLLNQARNENLILIDQSRSQLQRPIKELKFINAIMAGGRQSEPLLAIIRRVVANLKIHRDEEASRGFKPYDLLNLTGPENINTTILENGKFNYPHNTSCNSISFEREDELPIKRYQFKLRSDEKLHWSELQKTERLFDL